MLTRTILARATHLALVTALWLWAPPVSGWEETALDRYVAAPDPNYRYAPISTIAGNGYRAHVLEMTSQQWRSAAEVDRPIWTHWLTVVEPERVRTRIGVLVISGGSIESKPPTQVNPLLATLSVRTGSVVSEVRMVPNEPLKFTDEARSRKEDEITAYTWDKYLRTGDETWPIRLPMTKSVVRAMDTISAFCAGAEGGAVAVDQFLVGGASKRGWTAWMTAAVDRRVVAIVPVVIDMLNIEPSFEHHYRAYGVWAPTLGTFLEKGIMRWRGTPELAKLIAIEDPYAYRDRLTIPKFIVNATGDQYFLPDSSQFYVNDLEGETYLRYVPNTDHAMRGLDTAESALAFYQSIIDRSERPKFDWRFEADGSIRVKTETKPSDVRLWQAVNSTARDFRLQTIGAVFQSSVLSDQGDGIYIGRVAPPERGWIAYFVELTYPTGDGERLKFTTGVRVAPDVLPFALPTGAESAMPQGDARQ